MDYTCPACGHDLTADTIDVARVFRGLGLDAIELPDDLTCPACATALARPRTGTPWSIDDSSGS